MEEIAEQVYTERAEHIVGIGQLEGDVCKLKGKLKLLERRNNVADFWYFLLVDECNMLKRQLASSGFCCREMVQRLGIVSKDVVS